jgi:hypothetical protein
LAAVFSVGFPAVIFHPGFFQTVCSYVRNGFAAVLFSVIIGVIFDLFPVEGEMPGLSIVIGERLYVHGCR